MNIRSALAVSLVLFSAACAAPEEDDADAEGANSAISTPRDEENTVEAKVDRLEAKLDDATSDYFEQDFGTQAKPYLDEVLAWVKAGLDPKARLYSFEVRRDEKVYLVEMRGSWTTERVFYAYEAIHDGGYGGFFKKELTPKPLARCTARDAKAAVECQSVKSGAKVYEPPKK